VKPLRGWDAFLLYSETPNVHQHTLKVAVVDTADFEGEPTFDAFRRILGRRLHVLEPLRYQLIRIPFHLHPPMWLEDAEIDLDYHVRRLHVPAPGGRRELDQLIGEIASTPLDRDRPLWKIYFVEGLANNRVAVIGKIHHALADGVASAHLMARGMEWPDSVQAEAEPNAARELPSTAELLHAAGRSHLNHLAKLPGMVRDSATGIYRLGRRARERRRDPQSAPHSGPPPTFINHRLSPGRTFASATLSLAEVKETSKHLGVTINDMVLATAAGGLRELLLRYDGRADQPLIANVPAATDTSPDRISGNALSSMLVPLPVHVADPLERVRLTAAAARIAKEDHELFGPTTVGRWLEYLFPITEQAVFRWLSRRRAPNRLINVIISNVAGPRDRGRIAGAVVTEIYSVGPVAAGIGLNMTVWSYADQFNISVLADDLTLKDPHEATYAMIRAFADIRSAAGFPATLTEIATAMPQATPTG
jgi:diacylglycerol O-acyltransferase / wax synthase